MLGSAEEFGLSLVVLSLVFACAALIRRWSRPLRKLFMPTAVIGGFLVLGLGPEGMGRLLGGSGVFQVSLDRFDRPLSLLSFSFCDVHRDTSAKRAFTLLRTSFEGAPWSHPDFQFSTTAVEPNDANARRLIHIIAIDRGQL